MKKYSSYETLDEEVQHGFESLIQLSKNYNHDKKVFDDYIYCVNHDHEIVFFELLHSSDKEIKDFATCKNHAYLLLQRQKSIISLCNQQSDIEYVKAKLKELKEYLKKYYKRLGDRKRTELKNAIKHYSEEVILLNNLLIMYDLDDRSNSNGLVREHQQLFKNMKSGVRFDSKNKRFEFDFSTLQKIKNRKKLK
ncbi:hypothetical protein [Pseudoalteromonas gelatinilytica]|uniref:Uncharacterized protein n=1 Tax=Pseudoalteromonas gelatinilytica TaxID=1703256 RepID=A0ABQ1TC39_9GAMM|nr:hypothetical protein [Pseudoalteromonas profundi]GGE91409.1 hypothetical protein GCM10008027_15340 [Pseudoalteromonas profundi]